MYLYLPLIMNNEQENLGENEKKGIVYQMILKIFCLNM